MLALSPEVGYIHEPFNPEHRPGVCKAKFEYWFTYVCDQNESLFIDDFRRTLCFDYGFSREMASVKSLKDFLRLFRDYGLFLLYKSQARRPLVKDPIALFSTEWLVDRFAMNPVILVRHPAAFAGSLKKAGWFYPFKDFIIQPLLMERYLESYRLSINKQIFESKDIIGQAILLWNLFHAVILEFRNLHSEWIFLKHEDLSRDPVEKLQKLFHSLELEFPEEANKLIHRSTSGEGGVNQFKRNSRSNIFEWKKRLSAREVERIHRGTNHISKHFYTDDEW
ncbi:hypothetical protein [Thiorhodovibrio litoralis]|uniref:hypothetical protein n=1 Tax=Thiorhodovibrio litoralis TaxID=2952932 RepID=UPI002B25DA25|nr:hypothetical protein [Thiorhodovibrio litoralis]